jgi:hypothetical protein
MSPSAEFILDTPRPFRRPTGAEWLAVLAPPALFVIVFALTVFLAGLGHAGAAASAPQPHVVALALR